MKLSIASKARKCCDVRLRIYVDKDFTNRLQSLK